MTKKQIDDLAEIMANKVIEKIEAKQKEWDKEFERNMQKQQDANDVAWNDSCRRKTKVARRFKRTQKDIKESYRCTGI